MSEHSARRIRAWNGESRGRPTVLPQMTGEEYMATVSLEEYLERTGEGDMAEHDWYQFDGSARNISALYKTLNTNAHFLVSGTKTTLFIRIQHEEAVFVSGISKSHSVKSKLVNPPKFQEAACGKLTIDVGKHKKACKGCKRLKGNEENAQASSRLREAVDALDDTSVSFDFRPDSRSPDRKWQSGVGSTQPENPLLPPPSRSSQRRAESAEWRERSGEVTVSHVEADLPDLIVEEVEEPVVETIVEEVVETVASTEVAPVVDDIVEDPAPAQPGDGPTLEWLDDMAHYYLEISFKYERLAELMKRLSDAKTQREAAEKQYEETRKTLLEGI